MNSACGVAGCAVFSGSSSSCTSSALISVLSVLISFLPHDISSSTNQSTTTPPLMSRCVPFSWASATCARLLSLEPSRPLLHSRLGATAGGQPTGRAAKLSSQSPISRTTAELSQRRLLFRRRGRCGIRGIRRRPMRDRGDFTRKKKRNLRHRWQAEIRPVNNSCPRIHPRWSAAAGVQGLTDGHLSLS